MCGIAGIISNDPSAVTKQALATMTDAIAHRGPDGEQQWINLGGTTGLGHRRLAILDLSSAGIQPMHYQNRFSILHNGEIYNYLELKESLEKKGYRFHSRSDTEVILAAYACYGRDCCSYFDGMFAFAIWDEQEQELFAARDRFGEKPFFYSVSDHKFIFASETKAIRALIPGHRPDREQVINFLTLGYTRSRNSDGKSLYEGISELPPASYLTYNLRKKTLLINKYWELDKSSVSTLAESQVLETFGQLLMNSVTRRLRSDVELGCSLSGGLDSSSIVAAISKIDYRQLQTYSAVFPGFARDESAFVQLISSGFKTSPNLVTPHAEELVADLDKFIWHQETFVSSASIYAQYAVFKRARENGTVVLLDGQGADETMAGYNKYIHWGLQEIYRSSTTSFAINHKQFRDNNVAVDWSWKNKLAAWQPSLAASMLRVRELRKLRNSSFIHADYMAAYKPSINLAQKPVVKNLNDILYYDTIGPGLKELLHYADRNSMAHGREVRLPFLNHELVSFLFTLPVNYKLREGYTKWILRKIMSPVLPAPIAWRKDKVGYEPPQKEWMQHPALQEKIKDSKRKLVRAGILKAEVLDKKIQPQDSHAADNYDWRFLVTGLLAGQ